jgi:hypothetical protein
VTYNVVECEVALGSLRVWRNGGRREVHLWRHGLALQWRRRVLWHSLRVICGVGRHRGRLRHGARVAVYRSCLAGVLLLMLLLL